jgi:uncharacterized RmlC-like cupin family protein
MPILAIGAEKSFGTAMADQMRFVALDVTGSVIANSGHWLMEEQPVATVDAISAFLRRPRQIGESKQRLTPADVAGLPRGAAGAGTSGVDSIETTVLLGDPTKPGIYTIALHIPANTVIVAHTHRDDRVAVVVSGTWYFGYGVRRDPAVLKSLPAGSFYTEPAGEPHFAETKAEPVTVYINRARADRHGLCGSRSETVDQIGGGQEAGKAAAIYGSLSRPMERAAVGRQQRQSANNIWFTDLISAPGKMNARGQ